MSDSSGTDPPILNYADPNVDSYVVIAHFRDEAEARMAAGALEVNEIGSLVGDRIPSYGIGRRSADLAVLLDDVADAVEILKQTPAARYLASNLEDE